MKFAAGFLVAWVCSGTFAGESGPRSLTFEDRVKAQEAIERVYYAHRIGTTEAFEKAVPRAVLESKVRKYLEQTEALAVYWKTTVTDEMLQGELQRMAAGTRMPERLLELYSALGNDTFLIKECLGRATLVDRLTRDSYAFDPTLHKKPRAFRVARYSVAKVPWDNLWERAKTVMQAAPATPVNYVSSLAPVYFGTTCPVDDTWAPTSVTGAPSARVFHTAVWTGAEMIVWGGYFYDGTDNVLNTGDRYDPATDSWSPTSTTGAPTERALHTAEWTGSRMVVWGGADLTRYLDTGGRYDPTTDSWAATSMTGAPSERAGHTAMWTGSRMVVWGGYYFDGAYHELNTGGRYDPSTDTWTSTSTGANVPAARDFHTAVWTGNRMVVWGGWDESAILNTGGRYDPITNSWTTTSTTGAPSRRVGHTAVWTGSRMVVWGGWDGSSDVDTGGQYDPTTDSWSPMSTTDAPSPRESQTAVWTGSRMVVWGGGLDDGLNFTALDTGGRYDPAADSWTPTSATGVPTARVYHTAVWMVTAMVVWGGEDPFAYFDTGGIYGLGTTIDDDGDGYSVCTGDCNDSNPAIHPGASEVCNGIDDDCDTVIDNDGSAMCDDADVCTTDACNGGAGCAHGNNTAACSDGSLCTTNDTCGGGACVGGPALDCSDLNACTADSCIPPGGCVQLSANLDPSSFSDTRVDGRDVVVLADAWSSCPTGPTSSRYIPAANLDPLTPCIDDTDFHVFMTLFGRSCP
jgi:N-acetylneuraminic acid mutarotase